MSDGLCPFCGAHVMRAETEKGERDFNVQTLEHTFTISPDPDSRSGWRATPVHVVKPHAKTCEKSQRRTPE